MTPQQFNNSRVTNRDTAASHDNGDYVIAIDIGGTNLRMALADLDGRIAARWSSSTVGMCAVDVIIDLMRKGLESMLLETSIPYSALRAISAGAPGITDTDAGIVIATSYLLGWRDVPLRTLLENAFSLPATVDNDVNLAAIGESWAGAAQGTPDFVFLAIGTGIGAGVILNGIPFRGMGWSAGEIGYMLLPGTSGEPAKRSKPGAFEEIVGGEGIKARWRSLWREDLTKLPKDLPATEIFNYAIDGDPLAQTILQQSAQMLACAIYNISLVLNCPLFVLGGGVGTHPALCDATRFTLEVWDTRVRPQLIPSALGPDAQLMGAIRLAIDAANSR
jgi:glucokinase